MTPIDKVYLKEFILKYVVGCKQEEKRKWRFRYNLLLCYSGRTMFQKADLGGQKGLLQFFSSTSKSNMRQPRGHNFLANLLQ